MVRTLSPVTASSYYFAFAVFRYFAYRRWTRRFLARRRRRAYAHIQPRLIMTRSLPRRVCALRLAFCIRGVVSYVHTFFIHLLLLQSYYRNSVAPLLLLSYGYSSACLVSSFTVGPPRPNAWPSYESKKARIASLFWNVSCTCSRIVLFYAASPFSSSFCHKWWMLGLKCSL